MTEQLHERNAIAPPSPPCRAHLPDTRRSVTRHTVVEWCERNEDGSPGDMKQSDLYLTAGFYEDGSVAEVFARIDRSGSMLGQLVDAWVTALSIGLQHGIPLDVFVSKFRGMGAGAGYAEDYYTNDPRVPRCRGPVDYIARWLSQWVKEG